MNIYLSWFLITVIEAVITAAVMFGAPPLWAFVGLLLYILGSYVAALYGKLCGEGVKD